MITTDPGPAPVGLLAIVVLWVADLFRCRHCHREDHDHDHHH
jgi:hypothetical protein